MRSGEEFSRENASGEGLSGEAAADQRQDQSPNPAWDSDRSRAGGCGGAVHVGTMSGGAIATGAQGRAVSYGSAAPPAQTDEATLALLDAVRALRADIRVLAATDETAAVQGELGEIEGEITRTGHAGPGRVARLRDRLETGASAVGLLASATAVVQAAAQVLG